MQTEVIPYENRIGYACINTQLSAKGITTNRDAIKRTFETKGLPHISSLVLANVTDLQKVIKWNEENGIKFYRISSNLFPWWTEYELEDLPDWEKIRGILLSIGKDATRFKQRLEFHPSHFMILASPTESTVAKAIKDLNQHSRVFDEMGLEPSHWNCLNIHVGGAYGDKASATQRWCDNFLKLSDNCRKRIVVENDDKANMYSVADLYEMIYLKVGVPITFDIFHHTFCTGGLSAQAAATLAADTWKDAPMVIHWSSSKQMYESFDSKSVAHADYIYDKLNDWDTGGWFMCESKAKELSVQEYWKTGPRPQTIVKKVEEQLEPAGI
jgi:UV DNA damage endonuclease